MNINNINRILRYIINKSDLLLEVLDARMPKETRLYKLEKYINKKGKNLILVLNKADLVPEDFIEMVKEEFSKEYPTVYVSCKTRRGSRVLRNLIKEYSPEKEKIYVGIIGYPDTGKSSIINLLVGRHKVGTAPIPGFTKGIQLVKLSTKHYLIDTPGIVFPKNKYFLAILGGIQPEKLEYPEKAVKYLLEKLPKVFIKETYNLEFSDINDFLERIAEKFNYKGPDKIKKAAVKVLNDWIRGKIKGYWF